MGKAAYAVLFALLFPAAAFAGDGPESLIPYSDWIIFTLALVVTAWWSLEAFDRPSVNLADLPTFPRYMTRRGQYRSAKIVFVGICLAIYVLMIRYHRDLPAIIGAMKPEWSERLKTLTEQKDPSYLVVIIVVSACFLTLLKKEARWNVLLLFRDITYSWVAIPYLTRRIVDLTRERLAVPSDARLEVEKADKKWRVHKADFEKNPLSMDRAWAELCYLQWWILEEQAKNRDTTFFSEKSFAWEELNSAFRNLNLMVDAHKSGVTAAEGLSSETMKAIADHRKKLSRLIACYLVFMNSSRSDLITAAKNLGIELGPAPGENPLRYAAIYVVALLLSLHFGVFLSAVGYDLLQGTAMEYAIFNQDLTDVSRWAILAFGDYGIPILGILLLRYLAWRVNPVRGISILVSYSWIFVIAAILSAFGLSLMIELVGRSAGQWDQFWNLFLRETRWSIGPALICVYIIHYLDRQADPTRPDIGSPGEMPIRRIAYAVLFTVLVMAFTLPSIPNIRPWNDSVWDVSKLRFVALGTIFSITMCLALIAQFALPKSKPKRAADLPLNIHRAAV
jgi:hypothetical protein